MMKLIKYLVLFLCVFGVLVAYGSALANLFYPLMTPEQQEYFKHGFMKVSQDTPFYYDLGTILGLSSFFIVSFKLFKDRDILTRFVIGCVLLVAFACIASLRNETLNTILVILVIGTALFLLLFPLLQQRPGKTKKFPERKRETEGFVFETGNGKIYLDNPFRGIYIQGGAGSGKSVSLFEPIIEQISRQGYTGLLYDFKSPELSRKLFESYRKNNDIRTYFVDFKEPAASDRVNPITPEYLKKSAYALEYSTALINNLLPESVKNPGEFWASNARMVLAGTIWYLRNHYPQFCSLPHVISLLLHSDIDSLVNRISEDPEAGGMIASLKQSIERGAERQTAGVLSTIQNALSQLNTPEIFWILSGDDLDLDLNNPQAPTFLCLGTDSTLAQTYAPVISLIISVAMRRMNQPGREKSILLVDEAPTLYIPNLELIPATGRSNKIVCVFGVQDYSQMVDRYGHDKAQVILSNLGNQFFGRTVNVETARMIQTLFGKHDRMYEARSKGTGSSGEFIHLQSNQNKGTAESIQERERLKIQDITALGAGQFSGIIAEGSPIEFLNVQFHPGALPEKNIYQLRATTAEIAENYNKIVQESKNLFS